MSVPILVGRRTYEVDGRRYVVLSWRELLEYRDAGLMHLLTVINGELCVTVH